MSKLSEDEIKKIREWCAAATEGPWYVDSNPWKQGATTHWQIQTESENRERSCEKNGVRIAEIFDPRNQDFIAHARTDIPALLADLAARAAEERKREELWRKAVELATILKEGREFNYGGQEKVKRLCNDILSSVRGESTGEGNGVS